jgi:hypothetical protein
MSEVKGIVDIRGSFYPHKITDINQTPHDPDLDEGRLVWDDDIQALFYGSSTGWVRLTDANDMFNVGQKIMFASQPLPTGWNIDASLNDRVIMITDAQSQIGITGGTWTISGMRSNGGHNHFAPGGIGNPNQVLYRGVSEIYATGSFRLHKHTFTTNGAHTHTFQPTWRPAHVEFILAEYQGV